MGASEAKTARARAQLAALSSASLAPGLLGVDTETKRITQAEYVPRLVVLSVSRDEGASLVHRNDVHAERTATAVLTNRSTWANGPYDWAVLGKEYPQLMPVVFRGLRDALYHDVLSREKLYDIATGRYKFLRGKGIGRGYSLQACMYRRTKRWLNKDETRLVYGDLIDKPIADWPASATKYARSDPAATVYFHRNQEMRREAFAEAHEHDVMLWRDDGSFGVGERPPDVFEDEYRQLRAKWSLHLISANGICVDQEEVGRFSDVVDAEYQEVGKRLRKGGLLRTEDGRLVRCTKVAKARMERVCADIGIDLRLTEHEQTALDEESCERSGDDLLISYARFVSLQKLRGTYIKVLRGAAPNPTAYGVDLDEGDPPDPEGRYHVGFDELVDTGRTSCRGILQVLPRSSTAKGIRECFVAPPGKKLVAGDFGKAELVGWSQIHHAFFGRSTLGDALTRGIDPHVILGAQILGCSYEEALARKKAGDLWAAIVREAAKPGNFGFPVGMGAETYVGYAKSSYGVRLPGLRLVAGSFVQVPPEQATLIEQVAFAKMVKASWRRSWAPEADEYLDLIGSMIPSPKDPEGKPLRDSEGRLVRGRGRMTCYLSNRIRGGVSFTECANSYFQSICADGAKHALWCVTWRQYMEPSSALFGTKVVNFVHDEVVVEVDEDRARAVARELEEVMVAAYGEWARDVPVVVEARVSQRWTKE